MDEFESQHEKAMSALQAAIAREGSTDIEAGLQLALVMVERVLPDLRSALTITISALDDASTVVDASDDEDYAYQAELEAGRSVTERVEKMAYDEDVKHEPGV